MGGWVDRTRSLRMSLLSAARRLGWRMGDSDTTRQRLLAIPSPVAAARVAAVVGLRGRGRRRRGGEGRADPDGLYFGAAVATPTRKGSFGDMASGVDQESRRLHRMLFIECPITLCCTMFFSSEFKYRCHFNFRNRKHLPKPPHFVSLVGKLSQSLSSQEVPGIQRERATVTLCLS